MGELNGLKILSMFVVGLKRGNQLEELECLNLSGRLRIRHLERVKDHMDAKKAKIAEKNNLHELRLSWQRNDLTKLEEEVDERVLEALEPHPILCFPKLGELPHLEKLYLKNMGMEYIIEEEEVGSGHPGLSNKQESSKEAFPNLKALLIEHCSLLILPPLPSLQKLETLVCSSSTLGLLSEHIILRDLWIEVEESLACFPIEMLANFNKLQTLVIDNAKEISVTREGLQILKELKRLCLNNCEIMRCLPEGMLRQLTSLETLAIWKCPEVLELPQEIKHLHNLEFLMLRDLPKMRRLSQVIEHLTNIYLDDLPELESLPDQLPSLIRLILEDCPKVVSIPALPILEKLIIVGCPQLERRCRRGSGEDWHKISHVRSIYISSK
ncbi:disease resistance protein RGA2-like [Salvia hispanica]|uniref:disease resistance protein RGA2-like n=1 Tax=Salvia hispanica TaxID=49212 RepID=UPI002009B36C|nr:disease resistance protein RGA2-like [Salvia hispanica]